MEFADLKNKSAAELQDILKDEEQKLFGLRLKAHGRQLKQVHEIDVVRRNIARIQTLLTTKK